MSFNVSAIVSAIVVHHAAAWQTVLIEERAANPKVDADKALGLIVEGIVARVEAGEIDAESAKVYASHARTLMLCKLDTLINAAALGHGINGLCKRIREAEGSRSAAGRKAGQGKGKSTSPEAGQGKGKSTAPEAPAAEVPQVPQGDKAWKQTLEAMIASVPARKDWASEDIVAFQDCASKMVALIKRNAK